jgi:hypothetical protein
MRSSSSKSRRQHMIPHPSVKCQYCGRWFRNVSGRTKHIGVYHPRGESDLRQAFRPNMSTPLQQVQPVPNPPNASTPLQQVQPVPNPPNASTPLQQVQPVPNPPNESPQTDSSEPQSVDFDMVEHNDNGRLTFLSSSITLT